MIVYAEPSVLVRLLRPTKFGNDRAGVFRGSPDVQIITTSMALLECTSAAVRSARHLGLEPDAVLAELTALVDPEAGLVLLVDMAHAETEALAVHVARETGLRAMDSWHVACAELCFRELAEPGETLTFATRSVEQAGVARSRGWQVL